MERMRPSGNVYARCWKELCVRMMCGLENLCDQIMCGLESLCLSHRLLLPIVLTFMLPTTFVHAQSPYISRVYEYAPAPGQFINMLPLYEEGNTDAEMISKVEERILGQVGSTNYICLGAWGGYVTFGFDHPIVNVKDSFDLKIYGNAFVSGAPVDGVQYGSSEPGIIYVSQDSNGDGLPNDEWYEIAGSMADSATYNYSVTYVNAGSDDIPWQDNLGRTGYIYRNDWHLQDSYFPMWVNQNVMTCNGTLLPENFHRGRAYAFEYGYADNWPNEDPRSNIKLDWAIRLDGTPAHLSHIDFVRVQTGVLADWGVSGEISTEVCGAEDLHPGAILPVENATQDAVLSPSASKQIRHNQLIIEKDGIAYDIMGHVVTE